MAIILYPSGVLRDYRPKGSTFTDKEILELYKKFPKVRTKRLFDIPNTWMVWANTQKNEKDAFSHIGSSIIEEEVFTPILFVHDTEMDISWALSDDPILYTYKQFNVELRQFIDGIARDLITENNADWESGASNKNLIMLTTIGSTSDNRVLFDFLPTNQQEDFWKLRFDEFAEKTIKFLIEKQDRAFGELGVIIFSDKKIMIRVRHEHFLELLEKLNDYSEKHEQYEWCSFIKYFKDPWEKFLNNVNK